jgi:hypothetical protein
MAFVLRRKDGRGLIYALPRREDGALPRTLSSLCAMSNAEPCRWLNRADGCHSTARTITVQIRPYRAFDLACVSDEPRMTQIENRRAIRKDRQTRLRQICRPNRIARGEIALNGNDCFVAAAAILSSAQV